MAEQTGQGQGLANKEVKPTQSYKIKLTIADVNYSADVTYVEIVSSLKGPYQVVTISLLIDPTDVIIKDLYGDSKINLTIDMTTETAPGVKGGFILDTRNFELMIVDVKHQLVQRPRALQDNMQPPEKVPVTLTTVSRQSWKIMNTLVNKVFLTKTLNDIITTLARDVGANDLVFDSEGRNNNVIDQVVVPPITFYKAIKQSNEKSTDPYDGFLDQRFGLFDGIPAVFCQYDGKVYVKNLTTKMKKAQKFTIYKLVPKTGTDDIVEDSMSEKNIFYTRSELKTNYFGNAKMANIAPTIRRIIAPKDTLATVIEQNFQSSASKYGLTYKNGKLEVDPIIGEEFRIKYEQDTGYEKTASMFISKLARQVSNMSTVEIQLDRLLWLQNLMEIGEAVKLRTMSLAESKFDGMYILHDSVLKFTKKQELECTATLNLIRSNRAI